MVSFTCNSMLAMYKYLYCTHIVKICKMIYLLICMNLNINSVSIFQFKFQSLLFPIVQKTFTDLQLQYMKTTKFSTWSIYLYYWIENTLCGTWCYMHKSFHSALALLKRHSPGPSGYKCDHPSENQPNSHFQNWHFRRSYLLLGKS